MTAPTILFDCEYCHREVERTLRELVDLPYESHPWCCSDECNIRAAHRREEVAS